MLNLKTGKHFDGMSAREQMTRREFGRGLAAIIGAGVAPSIALSAASLAGSANASAARGMMRSVGIRVGMMDRKEDNRWAQEVMDKTYPTADIIEEHHNAQYTEELTKTYGGN